MLHKHILHMSVALVFTAGAAAAYAQAGLGSSLVRDNYPAQSLALGEQGTAEWTVDLDANARIESCVVTRSSGYPRLDAASCGLIVEHARFAPAKADGKLVATRRSGRIAWRLPAQYSQNATRAPQPVGFSTAELEAQRLICRRAPAPGSTTRLKTYCLTRDDWDLAQEYAQDQTERWMSTPKRN